MYKLFVLKFCKINNNNFFCCLFLLKAISKSFIYDKKQFFNYLIRNVLYFSLILSYDLVIVLLKKTFELNLF
jgi:hypothetical protein